MIDLGGIMNNKQLDKFPQTIYCVICNKEIIVWNGNGVLSYAQEDEIKKTEKEVKIKLNSR